jgi:hypothetical protein
MILINTKNNIYYEKLNILVNTNVSGNNKTHRTEIRGSRAPSLRRQQKSR